MEAAAATRVVDMEEEEEDMVAVCIRTPKLDNTDTNELFVRWRWPWRLALNGSIGVATDEDIKWDEVIDNF